jgi:omega-6 fatty acid desaturase (delta-12 desaturase)
MKLFISVTNSFRTIHQQGVLVHVTSIEQLKQRKRVFIDQYARPNNLVGLMQVVTTLIPMALLWQAAVVVNAEAAWWRYGVLAGITLLMSLFLLRVFVLMHECGHGSMFGSIHLNKAFGFVFGVVSGMPQQVWSEHHAVHHATNGNWDKYRGPLCVVTTDDYAAMTSKQQCAYRRARSIWLAPLAGFMYVLFNPRFTWMKGSVALVAHMLKGNPAATFKTRYWSSPEQYRAMFWNNVVLLCGWVAMSWWVGLGLFFAIYVVSMALAGGAGIVVFTVQHNFEHAYASADEDWDYDEAALHGTSFLDLPFWLNWFTADIAWHHIHHLSARIPNYRLQACHEAYAHLFTEVTRIRLSQVPKALKCILWDVASRRIVSVAEYEQQRRDLRDLQPA